MRMLVWFWGGGGVRDGRRGRPAERMLSGGTPRGFDVTRVGEGTFVRAAPRSHLHT